MPKDNISDLLINYSRRKGSRTLKLFTQLKIYVPAEFKVLTSLRTSKGIKILPNLFTGTCIQRVLIMYNSLNTSL